MTESNWQREIVELHDVFEAYFLGDIDDLDRVEAALAEDFTFVGTDARTTTRDGILTGLEAGHGLARSLEISSTDHRLVFEDGDIVVVEYVERQKLADHENRRLSTVIFSVSESAPNGLLWRRVHETWIDNGTNP